MKACAEVLCLPIHYIYDMIEIQSQSHMGKMVKHKVKSYGEFAIIAAWDVVEEHAINSFYIIYYSIYNIYDNINFNINILNLY